MGIHHAMALLILSAAVCEYPAYPSTAYRHGPASVAGALYAWCRRVGTSNWRRISATWYEHVDSPWPVSQGGLWYSLVGHGRRIVSPDREDEGETYA
jgi:hypothetical protein